jgi:uncharacterized small protein (DUF1192 family)
VEKLEEQIASLRAEIEAHKDPMVNQGSDAQRRQVLNQ